MKNTRHSAGVYILVGVGGFPRTALSRRLWGIPNDLTARCLSNLLIVPRTALSRRLWGIPDDLTARCLSNLLIVELVVLISPLHHKTKTDRMVGLCFGGSGWIVIPTAINCGGPLSLHAGALVPNQTIWRLYGLIHIPHPKI